MRRPWWIFDVGAGRIITIFIAELAFKNENLFTQFVLVLCELATGQITNDGGSTGDLITRAVEHASFYAWYRTGDPSECFLINDDTLCQFSIYLHGSFPLVRPPAALPFAGEDG
jgi:hypothetical protein